MKQVKVKSIKISTDGSIYFSYLNVEAFKQTIFYERDSRMFLLSKKVGKKQFIRNSQPNFYKSKYRF